MADVIRDMSPHALNFGQLIFRLNVPERMLVRRLEELYEKRVQSSYGVMFNKTCLRENLLSNYTNLFYSISTF